MRDGVGCSPSTEGMICRISHHIYRFVPPRPLFLLLQAESPSVCRATTPERDKSCCSRLHRCGGGPVLDPGSRDPMIDGTGLGGQDWSDYLLLLDSDQHHIISGGVWCRWVLIIAA